jgi:hypothetical protein
VIGKSKFRRMGIEKALDKRDRHARGDPRVRSVLPLSTTGPANPSEGGKRAPGSPPR